MKSIYLAGPMTGHDDYNFRAFFLAEAMLTMKGYRVVNPARLDIDEGVTQWNPHEKRINASPGFTRHDAMRRDILAIAQSCGSIAVLPGWEGSAGAQQEVQIAREIFGFPIFEYDPEAEDIRPLEAS